MSRPAVTGPVRSPGVLSARRAGAPRARRALAASALAVLILTLALGLAACGVKTDPFAGLWWEPATGRRIEIRAAGGSYKVLCGAAKAPFPATRSGDELRVADPLGGAMVFKQAAGGTLTLTAAGKTSVLKPVPQHQ
jgi:hypothetical protein